MTHLDGDPLDRDRPRAALGAALLATFCFLLAPRLVAECVPIGCGDCNLDTRVDILDALAAAQMAVQLYSPGTTQQLLQCDASATGSPGSIDVQDALVLAQNAVGLPVALQCVPVHRVGDSFLDPQNPELSVPDPGVVLPQLDCIGTTVFYEITPSPGATSITIHLRDMSAPTDLSLLVGAPGIPAGDLEAPHYFYYSAHPGPVDEVITLACGGLAAYGSSIAVAVHAVVPGQYSLQISSSSPACPCGAPVIEPGDQVLDRLEHPLWIDPPDPAGPSTYVDLWELSTIPPGTTRIDLQMVGPPPWLMGDYDLMVGNPGVCGGDQTQSNYHGTSPGGAWGNPLFREEWTISGDTLRAYAAGPLALGVAAISGPSTGADYTLDVVTRGAAGPPMASAPALSPVPGSIAHCRLLDYYLEDREDRWRFTASAGQTVQVFVDSGSSAPEGVFAPRAAIFEMGDPQLLASGYGDVPCSLAPPGGTGTDCPSITYVVPRTSAYEVAVARDLGGRCRDGANGRYLLHVTVDGVAASLIPTADDLSPVAW